MLYVQLQLTTSKSYPQPKSSALIIQKYLTKNHLNYFHWNNLLLKIFFNEGKAGSEGKRDWEAFFINDKKLVQF